MLAARAAEDESSRMGRPPRRGAYGSLGGWLGARTSPSTGACGSTFEPPMGFQRPAGTSGSAQMGPGTGSGPGDRDRVFAELRSVALEVSSGRRGGRPGSADHTDLSGTTPATLTREVGPGRLGGHRSDRGQWGGPAIGPPGGVA